MKKIWLFIWRMNPPHIWHKKIIDKSLSENDKTIIFLWSIDKKDETNPLSFLERKKILEKVYKSFIDNKKLFILWIKDNPDDEIWLKEIVLELNNITNTKDIILNIYGWDFKNDYAIKVIKQYNHLFEIEKINFIEISRDNFFIEYKWEKVKVSSTLLRKAIKEWNNCMIKKVMIR